jgi:O-antigen/teichoic acid export membrane protein
MTPRQTVGVEFGKVNKTLKNVIYVFSTISFSKLIGAFTSFSIPRILEPASFGIWITLLLIVSYAPIIALGTVETLLKMLPYHIGKGELLRAKEVEGSVLGSVILSAVGLLILGFSFNIFIKFNPVVHLLPQIRIMIVAASLSLISAFFFHRFAAHQQFKYYGIIELMRAIVTCLLFVSFSLIWGLSGLVLGYLATEFIICISTIMLSVKCCGKIDINFKRKLIWDAVRIGFPITLIWWFLNLQSSVDRVVSASLLGNISTGYYGLGISIISILILIPQSVNRVLYPKISEGLGKKLDRESLSYLIVVPAKTMSILLPLLIGILILILPAIYSYIFPKYLSGLLSAQILLLGLFFISLIGNASNYLIANNKQFSLLVSIAISLVINVLTALIVIKLGLNIGGVAASTSISTVILTTLIWKLVFKNLGYNISEQWRQIRSIYSPFLILIFLFILLSLLFPNCLNGTSILVALYITFYVTSYILMILFIPPYSTDCRQIYSIFIKAFYSNKI